MARILIVGGVAGGASTAARLRRLDEDAEIVLIERGDYISYANCGLPYYAGKVIQDRSRLFVMTPQKFQEWLAVDVRTGTEAIALDRDRRRLHLKDLRSGRIWEESYDALVLSPGAAPIRPPIPGLDLEGIFTLRSVPDVDRIKAWMDERRPERALVIGGGFIGLEMAENLHHRGVLVSVVEAQNQVMGPLDPEMAALVHAQLRSKKVELALGDGVKAFEKRGSRILATLASGAELPADLVILSVGVRPDTAFLMDSGLELEPSGALVVDSAMRTLDPNIYALGDAVRVQSPITEAKIHLPLAGPASKQARVVADNLAVHLGRHPHRKELRSYPGSIGTSIAKVFDITAAATGLNEKALETAGLAYQSLITHGSSHASYYPEALPLTLKTLFDPQTGRLFGAQVVGWDGVDKRIDLMAEVLRRGGSVTELAEIEHAYAPPFSSSKDPVNIMGMAAENHLRRLTAAVSWKHVNEWRQRGATLLDVRTDEEFFLGALPEAQHIPLDEIRSRLSEIPKDRPVLLYCGAGLRGYLAERILRQRGWTDVGNLSGGYKTWELATERQSNLGLHRSASLLPSIPSPELGRVYAEGSGVPEDLPEDKVHIHVDACGLQCPGPIMRLKEEIDRAPLGARIILSATDPGFARDAQSWSRVTGHALLGMEEAGGRLTATFEKRSAPRSEAVGPTLHMGPKGASIVVFSDDLDRALASFVIANGAAASGKQTTLFFTFWGLSVIKRRESVSVSKDFMGRMFGWMLPRHSGRLSLSKLNFGGLGRLMMSARMKDKRVDSLESMIQSALKAGVRLVACQMSMDIMGIQREELISGVEIGGVASYLEAAGASDVNLFI